ncbi:MAG: hypothetical protein WDN06_17650 [Asticcacaulis sp.]
MSLQKLVTVAAVGLVLATTASAQTQPNPIVLYDDGLQNGWQDWSWGTTNVLQTPAGTVKPIKVEGGAWSALDLHHDAIATAGYSKLTFYINGGVDGGQSLSVHVKLADGTSPASNYTIQPKLKSWAVVEVPLKDIGADNQSLTRRLYPRRGGCLQALLHHQDSDRIADFSFETIVGKTIVRASKP